MFGGKFMVENLEQYVTVSYANVIAAGEPNQEFVANKIPISVLHCMFIVLVSHEPRECGDSTYFKAGCYQYNAHTTSRSVYMKMRIFFPTNAPRFSYIRANNSIKPNRTFIISGFVRRITSDFTILEVMDIDFMPTNLNTVQNVQPSTSANVSEHRSDIDTIAEDIDSNISQAPKRPRGFASRTLNQNASSSTTINESVVQPQNSISSANFSAKVEDAPEDDELEFISEQIVEEEQKKTKNKRASKKAKN
ncbi:21802_t:CDS:2 [Dentiscutata erythropus]|uniref:21802_t:CDS:1 n=1 Tax=Dentiscutata erythropus TaxID=1348616 RepID=A0A9N8VRK0_9GLOM|nr:21802_t:CDS:2 [Dentiscutata erythropus]